MKPAGRRLLQLCLLLSGAAALILEIAWSRNLSLILGNSHQAVATVVASMMTGLCLGSVAASRALPRLRHLPRAYGTVEMAVGAYAALTPLLFKLVPVLLAPLYSLPGPFFLGARFLLVFLLLLPASAGMGSTLPLATAALSRQGGKESPGEEADSIGGRLYGLNTLGAFLGTLAGGFLLLPAVGLFKSTLAGAGLGLGVGTLVWLLSDSLLDQPAPGGIASRKPSVPADRRFAWVLPLYAASGFVAMVYEITWTRVLAPIAGTSVYSFTLILAAILAGIGLGSLLLSSGRTTAGSDPARGFAVGQILLAAASFASLWGLKALPDLMLFAASRNASRPGGFFFWQFLLFGFIVLTPGMILGALFPFAARLMARVEPSAGAGVGRVYAWNTAGSILGSLAAGFVLVEMLGSETTLAFASGASAALGLLTLAGCSGRKFRLATGSAGALLLVVVPLAIPRWDLYRMTSGVTQILRTLRQKSPSIPLADLIAGSKAPDARVVFHREGKTSTVTVIREWSLTWLRVDGKTDASSTGEDMLTQVLLGQLPFFFAAQPSDACVIGFGSGVTSHAVLTHPIRRLDNVEIERQVVEASRFFREVNFDPLADPRSRLIVDDARTALAYRPATYDVIVSEPSNPWMAGVNNLFTREFYQLVRRRLKPGGVFCQWVQSYELSSASLRSILDTLASVFPQTHLFSSHLGGDMVLLASDRPLALVPGAAELFPDRPRVAEDFARIGVSQISDLAILYTAPIPAPLPGAALNTDDASPIQYRAPLELLRGVEPDKALVQTSSADLERLFFPNLDERAALFELGKAASRRGALATLEVIASLLDQAGEAGRAGEMQALAVALRRKLDAANQINNLLLLADERGEAKDAVAALAALQQAETLGISGAEQHSRAGFAFLNLGRYAEAERHFDQAVATPVSRFYYQSLAARGATRFRLGRRAEGTADILAAKTLDPGEALAYLLFGLALFDAGERDAAFRELRQGASIAPQDERVRSTLEYLSSLPPPPGPKGPGPSPK
ncbi:MAG TPA: fused MFS/spermidine synthase [Candidatus Polarisedimenticolia bacterium]|jgi:spermidine synthase|nr:fused MFS/spermidine synthase [Candidatus Polarisedimenticolia bacterium]